MAALNSWRNIVVGLGLLSLFYLFFLSSSDRSGHGSSGRTTLCQRGVKSVSLVGIPKSGTTWLEMLMTHMLRLHCRQPESACTVVGGPRHPWPHPLVYLDERTGCTWYFEVPLPNTYMTKLSRNITDVTGKHFQGDHLIQTVNKKPLNDPTKSYVYIVRDPRDTIISTFFWGSKGKSADAAALAQEIPDYVLNRGHLARIMFELAYQFSAIAGLPKHRAHIVHYEDLKTRTRAEMEAIANFMGIYPSEYTFETAIARSDFDEMRKLEAQGALPGNKKVSLSAKAYSSKSQDQLETKQVKVRSGTVGGFQKYFGNDERACLNVWFKTSPLPEPLKNKYRPLDTTGTCSAKLPEWDTMLDFRMRKDWEELQELMSTETQACGAFWLFCDYDRPDSRT